MKKRHKKSPEEDVRTTLSLDAKTMEDLDFAASSMGGISQALEFALDSLVSQCQGKRDAFYVYNPKFLEGAQKRTKKILESAKEKQRSASSDAGRKRKSVVIGYQTLQCLNRFSKEHSLKREDVLAAALSYQRQLIVSFGELELDLSKELLREVKRHNDELLQFLEKRFGEVEKILDSEAAMGFTHLLYMLDPGMGCLDACEAFEHDITRLEESVVKLEEEYGLHIA